MEVAPVKLEDMKVIPVGVEDMEVVLKDSQEKDACTLLLMDTELVLLLLMNLESIPSTTMQDLTTILLKITEQETRSDKSSKEKLTKDTGHIKNVSKPPPKKPLT